MMKTTVYMIRHGQSEANLQDQFLGHGDLDLTAQGHAQAACAAEWLRTVPCDAIYASDLKRAFHTAEHTARAKGMAVTPDAELREIAAGKWEFMPFCDIKTTYPEEHSLWRADLGRACPTDGESVAALQRRIVATVTRIVEAHRGQTVFIFSHATPIRVMAAYCRGKTADEITALPWPTNASATCISYENGVFTLEEYSRDDYMGDLRTALPPNV